MSIGVCTCPEGWPHPWPPLARKAYPQGAHHHPVCEIRNPSKFSIDLDELEAREEAYEAMRTALRMLFERAQNTGYSVQSTLADEFTIRIVRAELTDLARALALAEQADA